MDSLNSSSCVLLFATARHKHVTRKTYKRMHRFVVDALSRAFNDTYFAFKTNRFIIREESERPPMISARDIIFQQSLWKCLQCSSTWMHRIHLFSREERRLRICRTAAKPIRFLFKQYFFTSSFNGKIEKKKNFVVHPPKKQKVQFFKDQKIKVCVKFEQVVDTLVWQRYRIWTKSMPWTERSYAGNWKRHALHAKNCSPEN